MEQLSPGDPTSRPIHEFGSFLLPQSPVTEKDQEVLTMVEGPYLKRHGKYFFVHKSLLPALEYDDMCDIHEEFLKNHPNGKQTAGFVMIRLTDEQIDRHWDIIRISSYRWEGVQGVGQEQKETKIPANYLDFLERIREHRQILWMDWAANIGVKVPVSDTLGYMGSLYAQNIVLGDWMLNLDRLIVALPRAWIFQEMSFGVLDKEAMGCLFEQLRELGRRMSMIPVVGKQSDIGHDLRRNAPEDAAVVKAYHLGCGCVASLLGRRAFRLVAAGCEWFQAIYSKYPTDILKALGFGRELRNAIHAETKAQLPGVDEDIWCRLLLLCSTLKGTAGLNHEPFNWTDEQWDVHRPELLELVCAPYPSCKSIDELVVRYSRGILGAALGCKVTYESDRPEAVTAVVRAMVWKQFQVELSATQVIRWAWQSLIIEMTDTDWSAKPGGNQFFDVSKIHAPIVAGASSFVFAPLLLHGALVTYNENTRENLSCNYSTADGGITSFEGRYFVGGPVSDAGLRGIVIQDTMKGLPEEALPKPQDLIGSIADIYLCVPGTEPFVTIARGLAFIILTQPCEEGNRVIALRVKAKPHEEACIDLQVQPPRGDIWFSSTAEEQPNVLAHLL